MVIYLKKLNLFLWGIVIANLFISCQEKRVSNIENIKIVDYSDIKKIERIDINIEKEVFLETNAQSAISEPRKIIDYKRSLFILTNTNKGTISIFNKSDGKFLVKINHPGKGPQEYLIIKDFTIDKESDKIFILDENARILVYTFDDVFLSEIKLADMQAIELRHLALTDNKIVMEGMDRNGNSLFIFGRDGKLLESQLKAPFLTGFLPAPLTSSGKDLYFHKKVCDTLYIWKNAKFEPYIFLDFGKYQLSAQEVFRVQKESPGKISNVSPNPWYSMHTFYETAGFFYFDLNGVNMGNSKPVYFHCFVRKSDNKPFCTDYLDFFKGILWHGNQVLGESEDLQCLITYLQPAELYEYRDKLLKESGEKVLPKKFEKLSKLFNSTKIDDNPIIVFINLKIK